jgi:hypothetical protein
MKLALTTAALISLMSPAEAAVGVGTTGADFLNVGVGARQLAMGGAFSAVDTQADANAVNWNPAALALIKKQDVTLSYNSLFQDENQGFLGYAAPLKNNWGVVAAGLNYLSISNIQARAGDTESADSTFGNDNYALNLSYGASLGENLSLGASAKFIHEQFFTLSESAGALDFGALYKTPIENLTAGASLHNLGTNIGPDKLPLNAQGGGAYKLFNQTLVLATDIDWLALDRTVYANVGGEYWLNHMLAVRAGYQFGHGADQLQSSFVGMGVGFGINIHDFTVDYAFLPYGNLGDTHRVTLGCKF